MFGKTEERKMERALITQYRASIEKLLPSLNAANTATALEIARIPEQIRGYGHVKERHLEAAKQEEADLLARFRSPAAPLGLAAE